MSGFLESCGRSARLVGFVTAAMFSISSGAAGATCGLCDTEIVLNSDLASCFLEKYQELEEVEDQTVVVDLSDCETRGIIEALPSANLYVEEPSTQFMIERSQLNCLRQKLEDPDLELDPSATIDLSSCI